MYEKNDIYRSARETKKEMFHNISFQTFILNLIL